VTKNSLITPRTLSGFRDHLPDQMMAREALMDTARSVYRSYGFSPIDTPALEYAEILLGKGGEESDKQLFRFMDQGDRDVALRFDLTVPLARYAAEHFNEIGTPFKRYHIGTVWRGERPQRGRFREFMQCDFDTIGTESNLADIETLLVIHDLMDRIGFSSFTIRVNNRLILNGLLDQLGLTGQTTGILRAMDKLPKIGAEAVKTEMMEAVGASSSQADSVLTLAALKGRPDEILSQLDGMLSGNEAGSRGVANLKQLFDACRTAGIAAERLALDVSIARGLDYYTGTSYETFLSELPTIGSVCSGGRYDNLAELFTKQKLPGIGASLGLDRLLAAMEELGLLQTAKTPAPILVTVMDANFAGEYLRIGRMLRSAGLAVEVFPDAKKLGKQLQYSNRKGFLVALIAGEEEFATGTWQVKTLTTGEQTSVPESELVPALQKILSD
jgi:histidyl-tRNA synthetase